MRQSCPAILERNIQETVPVMAVLILEELLPRLKRSGIAIENSPITPWDIRCLGILKAKGIFTTHEIRQMMDGVFR